VKKYSLDSLAKHLKMSWDKYDKKQFLQGMKVEAEHGSRSKKTNVTHDDPLQTAKIVLAHLNEKKDYYTRLKKVEK